MRFLALIIGGGLLAAFLFGTHYGGGFAYGSVTTLGTITLAPVNQSGISGTAQIAAGSDHTTFINAQIIALAPLADARFALMTSGCTTVTQALNGLSATAAGDAMSTSTLSSTPDDSWWLGVLSGTDLLACGHWNGAASPTTATPTIQIPTDGGTLVPVHHGPHPPDAPPVNPNQTPTPVGS